MNKPSLYQTQNLYEASHLLAKGFQFAGKRKAGGKYSILFQGDGVQEEALKFYNNRAKIDPKVYADSYRTLKDYIFERHVLNKQTEETTDADE